MPTYAQLMAEADALIKQADLKRSAAERVKNECQHIWGEIKYDPIVIEGRYIEGDAPGTMGVDFRPGFFSSGSTTPRWKRICKACGYVQTTQEKKLVDGSYGLAQEVPLFR